MSNDNDFWGNLIEESKPEQKKPTPPTPTPQTQTPTPTQSIPSHQPQTPVSDPFISPSPSPQPQPQTQVPVVDPFSSTQPEPLKTPTPQPQSQPPQPVTDPFSTSPTPTQSFTPNIPLSPPIQPEPTPTTVEDPFCKTEKNQNKNDFEKTKPATGGKNYSIIAFGRKGTGKTVLALSLPGKIFAFSFDQQTAIIHEEVYGNDPRIEVWDAIEFFNSKNPEIKLESAVKTIEYVDWLFENPCRKFQPDWILIDGTERLSHVCEMAMRAEENLLPYEGPKNPNVWKSRNDKVNNIVQRATQLAKYGAVYTAYGNIDTVTTASGEEKIEGPKWFGDVEQKTRIVIKTSSERTQNGRAFIAEVESSKVSFIPTGKRVIVGEHLNTGETTNFTGIKSLFTPEGVKKFFQPGGEQ
jgi:hypothetical protein